MILERKQIRTKNRNNHKVTKLRVETKYVRKQLCFFFQTNDSTRRLSKYNRAFQPEAVSKAVLKECSDETLTIFIDPYRKN